MNKSILKNYLYNVAYQILSIIIPFITTPYITRALGVTAVGTATYVSSIVGYFTMFGSLGLNLYGQRAIAYCGNNIEARSRVFYEIMFLRFIGIGSVLIVYICFMMYTNENRILYFMSILTFINTLFNITWLLQGLEEFSKIVKINMLVKSLGVAIIFSFVKNSADLPIYIFGQIVVATLADMWMWTYVPKRITKTTIKFSSCKNHFLPSILLFLPQIALSVYNILDKIMLGKIKGMAEVGIYNLAYTSIEMLILIVTAMGPVMLSRISSLSGIGATQEIRDKIEKMFSFAMLLSIPMTFGTIAVAKNFVNWFYGVGYESVCINIYILSVNIILVSISNVIGVQYLLAIGKQNKFTIAIVFGAVFNFTLNLYMIPHYGSYGASFATVIAELIVTLVLLILVYKELPLRKLVMRGLKMILSSLVMFICLWKLGRVLPRNYFGTAMEVVIGIIIYFSILIVGKSLVRLKLWFWNLRQGLPISSYISSYFNDKKVIYLTIDDGPSCYTDNIIDILEENKVLATFFVTNRNPEYIHLLKNIYNNNHKLGIHSSSHDYAKIYSSVDNFLDDMSLIEKIIFEETKSTTELLRFPGGTGNLISRHYCKSIMKKLTKKVEDEGKCFFDWNASSRDGMHHLSKQAHFKIAKREIGKKRYVIFLCHDREDNKNGIEALKEIIPYCLKQGYEFRTLDGDVRKIRQTPQN